MAKQLKLPVARVVAPLLDDGEKFAIARNERLLLVDVDLLRKTKTFATVKAQSGWADAACEDYLLGLMAQGPV